MSEDIQKGPIDPVRAGLPLASPDRLAMDDGARPPLIWKKRSAGAIWIVAGALLLLHVPYLLSGAWQEFRFGWSLVPHNSVLAIVALSGAIFIRAGIRIVRGMGSSRPDRGLGRYSLVSGLLFCFVAPWFLLSLAHGIGHPACVDAFWFIAIGVANTLPGPLLLTASVLALSEDVQPGPTSPRREGHPGEGYGPTPDIARAPYPLAASAAAIIWILFGCLVAVNIRNEVFGMGLSGLWSDDQINGAASFILADSMHRTAGGFWGSVVMGLIRVAFLYAGIQTLRGAPRDTLGMGVASMFVAVLLVQAGFVVMGITDGSDALTAGEEAAAMLAAGILALVGRAAYKDWRRADKVRRAR